MKKYNLIEGAVVSTGGIVLCKILGLIYVIPFYGIIGTQGGALYSYAYSIYAVFLNLSIGGIPTAISKIICEYETLGHQYAKKRSFEIASKILNTLGTISFLFLFIFSDFLARNILGNVQSANSVTDVSIAIKIVSLALLIVPRQSSLRGVFQGNKYLMCSSISSIIEQLVRVTMIIVGSYISVKVFHLPIKIAVYIALLGATVGALVSFIYLKVKLRKEKLSEIDTKNIKAEKKLYTDKILFKKILFYAIPFVLIDLLGSAYNVVDTFTIYRTITSLGYSVVEAETTVGVINTWGTKLNMIVISIAFGLIASLIPNIVDSYVKKDYKSINKKINQSMTLLLCTTIPMTIGISFLSVPIWNIFYGYDALSINIFRIFILQVVFYCLYTVVINISQSMNQTKTTLGILVFSFILKALLNVPMMHFCDYIGIGPYYGTIMTNAIIQLTAFIVVMTILKKKFEFHYKDIIKQLVKILFSAAIMLIILCLMKNVFFVTNGNVQCILTIIVYSLVGALVYAVVSYKTGLFKDAFGEKDFSGILKKIKKSIIRR